MNQDLMEYLESIGFNREPMGEAGAPLKGPRAPLPQGILFLAELPPSTDSLGKAARELLGRMMEAMKLQPEKSRLVELLDTESDLNQLETVVSQSMADTNPLIVIALGSRVASLLVKTNVVFEELRGKRHPLLDPLESSRSPITLIASYAPATLLKHPELKRTAWEDLQLALEALKNSTHSRPPFGELH